MFKRMVSKKANKTINSFIIAIMVVSISAFFIPVFSYEAYADDEESDGIIVVYENESYDVDAEEVLEEICDVSGEETICDSTDINGETTLVTVDSNEEEAIEELNDTEGIAFAQKNYKYELMETAATDDTYLSKQNYLKEWDNSGEKYAVSGANVINAWNIAIPESSVTIAVIDTGCCTTHVDLTNNLLSDLAYNAVSDETGASSVDDTLGHGTHVAGIAGGVTNNQKGMAGVSGNMAKILPIKVFDGEYAYTSSIIRGMSYLDTLINEGTLTDLRVINMSLGGYEAGKSDLILCDWIDYMRYDQNVLTVCAGGNEGITDKVYPGDYDSCLCVTSLDNYGNNSYFSDYNMYKDISAPGESVLSTVIYGDKTSYSNGRYACYGRKSGTSMAAPIVSGVAAMIWAVNSDLTVDEVIESIQETAHDVNTAKYDCTGKTGSAGAIDAAAAIEYATEELASSKESILNAEISLSKKTYVYDGKYHIPSVTVTLNGEKLEEGTDYLVSSDGDGTKVGVYNLEVRGKGEYKNKINASYTIIPKSTSISKLTKGKKKITIKWKAQKTQTTGYQIRYSLKSNMANANSTRISKNTIVSKTIKNLKAKKTYYVQIRTYRFANGKYTYSTWSSTKKIKTK